jgi:hypothetical protein
MPDQIRYDLLTQQALRGVVRRVLADAAKKGLPGDHHFYISFDTGAEGVRLSERLRIQYPEQMTVILQHQFWDLAVNDNGFEVGMSFGGIPEKLYIPFDAINGFFDPSVQFGLQFEEVNDGPQGRASPANAQDKSTAKSPAPSRVPAIPPAALLPTEAKPAAKPAIKTTATEPKDESTPEPDKPEGGGQVVRLDRFRKK